MQCYGTMRALLRFKCALKTKKKFCFFTAKQKESQQQIKPHKHTHSQTLALSILSFILLKQIQNSFTTLSRQTNTHRDHCFFYEHTEALNRETRVCQPAKMKIFKNTPKN